VIAPLGLGRRLEEIDLGAAARRAERHEPLDVVRVEMGEDDREGARGELRELLHRAPEGLDRCAADEREIGAEGARGLGVHPRVDEQPAPVRPDEEEGGVGHLVGRIRRRVAGGVEDLRTGQPLARGVQGDEAHREVAGVEEREVRRQRAAEAAHGEVRVAEEARDEEQGSSEEEPADAERAAEHRRSPFRRDPSTRRGPRIGAARLRYPRAPPGGRAWET
jgi:hypothetical protein